ncbi:hypothetical protein SAMN02745121_08949, partial [Nannocystis exedens]
MLFNHTSILLTAITLGFAIPWTEPTCDCNPHPDPEPECKYNEDCSGDEICVNYECVSPPECQVDADCDPGEICKDYVCVTPPECQVDAD